MTISSTIGGAKSDESARKALSSQESRLLVVHLTNLSTTYQGAVGDVCNLQSKTVGLEPHCDGESIEVGDLG